MDKGITYTPEEISVWQLQSNKGEYKVPIDFINSNGKPERRIFQTYDRRIEDVMNNKALLVLTILEVSKIDDMASLNWVDGKLHTININDNNEDAIEGEGNEKIETKVSQSSKLVIQIRSWTSRWLNRWNYFPPIRFNYRWTTGVFHFSEKIKMTESFSLWEASLEIIWENDKWNMLATLEWINWVVTGDVLDIITVD